MRQCGTDLDLGSQRTIRRREAEGAVRRGGSPLRVLPILEVLTGERNASVAEGRGAWPRHPRVETGDDVRYDPGALQERGRHQVRMFSASMSL